MSVPTIATNAKNKAASINMTEPPPIGGRYSPFVRGSVHKVRIVDNFANKRDVRHFCRAPCGRINPTSSPQGSNFAYWYFSEVNVDGCWARRDGFAVINMPGAKARLIDQQPAARRLMQKPPLDPDV